LDQVSPKNCTIYESLKTRWQWQGRRIVESMKSLKTRWQ